MAWSIIEKGGPGKIPTYRKFIVDLITDLATLPTVPEVPAGSIAYCSENSSVYILEIDGDWALKDGSTSDIGLENLDDVDISEPSDGDAIVYDSTTEKWVNKPPSADGGTVILQVDPETGRVNKTWKEIYDLIAEGQFVVINMITNDYTIQSMPVGSLYPETIDDIPVFVVCVLFLIGTGAAQDQKLIAESIDDYPIIDW